MKNIKKFIFLMYLFFSCFNNLLGATEGRTVNIADIKREGKEYVKSNPVVVSWYWQPKLFIDSIKSKKVNPGSKTSIEEIFTVENDDEGDYKLSIINEDTEDFIAKNIQIFYKDKLVKKDDIINLKKDVKYPFEIDVETPQNVLSGESAKFYIKAIEQDTKKITSKGISLIVEGGNQEFNIDLNTICTEVEVGKELDLCVSLINKGDSLQPSTVTIDGKEEEEVVVSMKIPTGLTLLRVENINTGTPIYKEKTSSPKVFTRSKKDGKNIEEGGISLTKLKKEEEVVFDLILMAEPDVKEESTFTPRVYFMDIEKIEDEIIQGDSIKLKKEDLPNPELEIYKSSDKEIGIIGDNIEYKVNIKNTTNKTLEHLKIFDDQLNGINVIESSIKIDGVNNIILDKELKIDRTTYTFSFDKTFLPGEEIELTFTSLIDIGTSEQITTSKTWVEGYDIGNIKSDSNISFLDLSILKESMNKIKIEKKIDNTNIYIGKEIEYTIKITNTTNEVLDRLTISDEILEGLDLIKNSVEVSKGKLDYNLDGNNKFNFSILGDILPNEKITIKYRVLITPQIILGSTFTEGIGYGQTYYYETNKFLYDLELSQVLNENLLVITKEVNKDTASIGELIKYSVIIKNITDETLNELNIFDKIPRGLRLEKKSISIEGMTLKEVRDGEEVNFKLDGEFLPGKEIKMTYIMLVTNSVKIGDIINSVRAIGSSNKYYYNSNIASAVVKIEDNLFEEKGIIFGRVFVDKNDNNIFDVNDENKEIGVPGIKIYLENGDYAITDREGMYSIYGQRSITHVVKIDDHTVPKGVRLKKLTNKHNKKGDLSYADLKTGQLHKVNFAFTEFSCEFLDKVISRRDSKLGFYNELEYEFARDYNFKENNSNSSDIKSEIVKDGHKEVNFSLNEKKLIIEDKEEKPSISLEDRLQRMSNELGFIDIKEGCSLGKKSTIRVKGPRGGYLNLYVNDKLIPLENLGSRASSQKNDLFFLEYNMIDLEYGKNKLCVSYSDAFQIEREKKEITVIVPGKQEDIKIEVLSPLIADSSKSIKIKVIGIDSSNLKIIDPITIEAEITDGKWYEKNSDPNSKKIDVHGKTGEYIFTYLPPNESKTVKIKFTSNTETKEIELKLSPNLRPMTISGILEGRFDRYNKANDKAIDGYIIEDSLDGYNSTEKTSYSSRNAIFAKGVVAKDYLLTLSYDDNKKETSFFKDMDLDEHYLIYGDSSVRGYEGKSKDKLYLKIDKNYSSLLYGDYNADWTKNETSKLGKVHRTLTGGYHKLENGKFLINTFAAKTEYIYTTEEQRGRGISGPYHLENNNIVVGSEKITRIVRDRVLNSIVIEEVKLSRDVDYTLDYNTASIYFMKPIASMTPELNPIFIRVDYEVEGDGEKYLIWGNNLEYKFNDTILLGWNFAKDKNPDNELEVESVFGKIDFDKDNIATMEYAQTRTNKSGRGSGWRADFKRKTKKNNLTLEYYTTDENFDNDSSSLSKGKESYLLKSDFNLDGGNTAFFNGKYELEKETQGKKQEIEAGVVSRLSDRYNLELKGRYAIEEDKEDEETKESTSIGARLNIKSKKIDRLSYFTEYEQDLLDFDKKRLAVGSDYQLEAKTKLYVRQELFSTYEDSFVLTPTNSSNATLIGVESDYFNTATLFSEYSIQNSSSEKETKASMGVKKDIVLSEKISGDFTFERIFPIEYKGDGEKDESTAATISYKVDIDELKKFSGNFEGSLGTDKDIFTNKFGYIEKTSDVGSFLFKERYIWEDDKDDNIKRKGRISLGYAHRDYLEDINNWLFKSEINYESEEEEEYDHLAYILSYAKNYQFSEKSIGTLTLSGKYIEENLEKISSNYLAYLLATNYSFDITKRIDLNLNGVIYGDENFNDNKYGVGAEIGVRVQDNLWISVGYNVTGFIDKDFDQHGYYRQGVYLRFRINFDEDLFNIRNKK